MNKLLRKLFLYALVFLAGAATMYFWNENKNQNDLVQMQAIFNSRPQTDSMLSVDLKNAELVEGVEEAEPDQTTPQSGAALPSQLTPIDLSGVDGIANENTQTLQDLPPRTALPSAPVDLSGVQVKTPAATDNFKQGEMPTNITMIEVPVKARVIASAEDYKAFKREAMGSYPAADFETEQVLVLESQSNLPDKVFEIVDVQQGADKVEVLYRVNVFGLDKKTNTHSAAKIGKTDAPIVLIQVL